MKALRAIKYLTKRGEEKMLKRKQQPTTNHREPWHALNECIMAGNKKRKALSQAIRAVQLQNTYVQLKRTRSDAFSSTVSSTAVSKLEAALSNDPFYGWTLTSNLKILQKKNFYNIVVNRREKAECTKGKQRFSTRYADQNSAEKQT